MYTYILYKHSIYYIIVICHAHEHIAVQIFQYFQVVVFENDAREHDPDISQWIVISFRPGGKFGCQGQID